MARVESREGIEARIIKWARENRRTATVAAGVLVLIIGGIWFWRTASLRRENFAERALQSARSTAEAGNLALAASDLSRLVSTYGGSRAAEEAVLLLAQIRLADNQPAVAAADLRTFLASGPREEFRAPANSLLGAALEESGQFREAAQAHERAAAETGYDGVRAKHLLDAARAYTVAGDTAEATRIYRRVVAESATELSAIEAQIRLSELTKGG